MPRIVREADVRWEGNLARGAGAMSAASSGAFTELGYSLPTRIGAAAARRAPRSSSPPRTPAASRCPWQES